MKKISLFVLLCLLQLTSICQVSEKTMQFHLLVGTYTSGKSKGIYLYEFNALTGKAAYVDSVATADPSYLTVSEDEKFVYAVNELGREKGPGTVTSFSYDKKKSSLKELNKQSTEGDDPCYLAVDNTGNWLVAGNYSGGNFSVFPINKWSGTLGKAISTIAHQGKGVDPARQDKPHIHCTVFSPDNHYLLVADLGIDKIVSYSFDEITGKLQQLKDPVSVKAGAGPRHLVFHPNQKLVYLTEEMSGMVTVFDYNKGVLTPKQTINALPAGFTGKISAADIHIATDARFLYCSNRGDANSITIFSMETDGTLSIVGQQPVLGITPRNFSIDPSGNYLLVANQDSNEIVIFKRDVKTGVLTDTNNRISTGNPVCLKWLP